MFEHRFEPTPKGVPSARGALRAWLHENGTDADVAYDVLVVASELATNGVLHDGGDKVTIRARIERDVIWLAVDTVDLPESRSPLLRSVEDPLETGRGLPIVEELTDEFKILVDGLRRRTWCRIQLENI